jgi:hypothetical protein
LIRRDIRQRWKQQRLKPCVVQRLRQRPGQAGPAGAAQVVADRTLAQSEALADHPLWQMVFPSQAQKLAHLSHRQSLTWYLDLLLLGKRSTLPSVEDCQWQSVGAIISAMIGITGIGDQDRTDWMIRIHRNQ